MVGAPYEDKSWEIWACQTAITYPACKRADVLFELHDDSYWRDPAVIKRVNDWGVPVYMQRKVDEIPLSKAFPLEDIAASFKGFVGARYFTSTISMMMGLALHEQHYDRIALWGVHMEAAEEYGKQRSSMEYWVGMANGLGIQVDIPAESALCRANYVYGYDSESAVMSMVRQTKDKMVSGLANIKNDLDSVVQRFHEQNGAIKVLDYLSRKGS
jgi:hypothetical protein